MPTATGRAASRGISPRERPSAQQAKIGTQRTNASEHRPHRRTQRLLPHLSFVVVEGSVVRAALGSRSLPVREFERSVAYETPAVLRVRRDPDAQRPPSTGGPERPESREGRLRNTYSSRFRTPSAVQALLGGVPSVGRGLLRTSASTEGEDDHPLTYSNHLR